MKNLKFVSGMFLGVFLGALLIILVTCKSESSAPTEMIPDSFTYLKGLDTGPGSVYKLTIDNIQYIVVKSNNDGGIAIIRHQ